MKPFFVATLFFLFPARILAGPAISDRNAPIALQERCFDAFFRTRQPGVGTGSGFFIFSRPYEGTNEYESFGLTAYHCVDDADTEIFVDTVSSGSSSFRRSYRAELVAHDEQADVAVLRVITDSKVSRIKLARSRGRTFASCPVFTIGCSNGEFPTIWSDTCLGTREEKSQCDWTVEIAPLHGRSGGPLVNADTESDDFGRALGVCIRIGSDSRGIYSDLEKTRRVVRNAGLPETVVNGGPSVISAYVAGMLLLKLIIGVVLVSLIRLR